ncbi:hypothetical protein ACLI4Y_07430 [Natrialbaceae archaeon A-CW3]
MGRQPSRRELVTTIGVAPVAVTGCLDLLSEPTPELDVVLTNHTPAEQQLKVQFLTPGEDAFADALTLRRDFHVPPRDDPQNPGTIREEQLLADDRYHVRCLPRNGDGRWYTHEYFTSEETGDTVMIRIEQKRGTDGVFVRFT